MLESANATLNELDNTRRLITDLDPNDEGRRTPSQLERAKFDEPTLAIVGMWRYGGGANVHFSLALAETMSCVGQRYIAWAAYERTARLLQKAPFDEKTRQALDEHIGRRQSMLAGGMSRTDSEDLRRGFDADLKAGLDYQAAYQQYEADRIAAGASIDDPKFYDAFLAKHGEIATPPGLADFHTYAAGGDSGYIPFTVLGAGLFAFTAALFNRRRAT
ncbi:MAG TPA: hypothetical protein VEA69_08390 [Tepidisphaeraceae bacterium]|nr:hypothetical protein [Tepidisphaeraceae bacterium]